MTRLRFLLAAILLVDGSAFAQEPPVAVQAETIEVDAAPNAVTVYLGRASVTRTAELELQPGVYDLNFTGLPAALHSDSLQARGEGPAKILGVDYEERAIRQATSSHIAELDRKIGETKRALEAIEEDRGLLAAQEKFLDAVTVRARGEATDKGGTNELDLDAVREQFQFIAEERANLLEQRRTLDGRTRDLTESLRILEAERAGIAGGSRIERAAVVSIAVIEAGQFNVDLVYLVGEATWQPAYNIRSTVDSPIVAIEYDAQLSQRTGEDWDDVQLTLSTAQPTLAANPPELEPWFVDIARPPSVEELRQSLAPESRRAPTAAEAGKAIGRGGGGGGDEGAALGGIPLKLAADALVAGGGPSVTYALPRLVTVTSNARKQKRTRIATIDAQARFVHVAVPALTDAVYIRGELTNRSTYQILPGAASIFVGRDYVGPTRLAAVAPNGTFELHFGIDRTVSTSRMLVKKETSKTGLFAGGRKTSYDYRIEIDNNAGKTITLELWDRYPISRTDQIQIDLVDVQPPLAADAEYMEEQKPQGLLKWNLNVPATANDAAAMVITYGVRINRGKGVEMTPLPD